MPTEKPIFVEIDTNKALAEAIAFFEQESGRPLFPAQPERLIINTIVYREMLLRQAIQDAATQNLIRFSTAPVIDYLGELVGVKRLAPAPASCTLQFNFIDGHGGGSVPAGTRVATTDGQYTFVTILDVPVPPGVSSFDVDAEATVGGIGGNGYTAGAVSNLLDPNPIVESVANLATTQSGTGEEDDESLRERIMLAPGSFSNAGSRGAYVYWTRTAHPTIIDVAVVSPVAGTVTVYPLVDGGITTPEPVINAVIATLNDEKIRPLTDTVIVESPTAVTYAINVNLTVLQNYNSDDVKASVEAALADFVENKRLRLGRDVIEHQVIAVCMQEGVYNAVLTGWTDKVIAPTEFPKNTGVTVTVTGTNVG